MTTSKRAGIIIGGLGLIAGSVATMAMQIHAQTTAQAAPTVAGTGVTQAAVSPAASTTTATTSSTATVTQDQANQAALNGKSGLTITTSVYKQAGNLYEIVLSDGTEVKVDASTAAIRHTESAARETQEQANGDTGPVGGFMNHDPQGPDDAPDTGTSAAPSAGTSTSTSPTATPTLVQ